ncbi:MAG: 4Fe-4S dicluster domain-containing protein [bacterium]
MSLSRREFLTRMAAGASMAALGSRAAADTKVYPGYPDSYGVLHDTTLCIGCGSCEAACNRVNHLPPPEKPFDDPSVMDTPRRTTPHNHTVVNRFPATPQKAATSESEAESAPGPKPVFCKIQCNHCLEPACASACFVKAFTKVPEGPVVYDESLCVGCRYCMVACPFNVPTYEYDKPLTPRVMKCDMCYGRIREGTPPGCVEVCPEQALIFGKRNVLLDVAKERIQTRRDRYVDHIYGEHEVGGTSWLYISDKPFGEIGMRTNLGRTPAPELTKPFLSAVPIVLTLWPGLLMGAFAFTKRRETIAGEERAAALEKATKSTREEDRNS